MRPSALSALLVVALALCTGCASTESVQPTRAGTWRVGGSTGASFRTTDMGNYGDVIEYGVGLSVGRFVTPRVLLEISADGSFSDIEVPGEPSVEITQGEAVGGFRYYFEHEGRSRPYFGLAGGVSTIDIDSEVVDESDTSLVLVGRLGFETFISYSVTLDFGVRLLHVMDRELGGVKDDITQGAVLIGLAAYF
jgi:hypothetical protein